MESYNRQWLEIEHTINEHSRTKCELFCADETFFNPPPAPYTKSTHNHIQLEILRSLAAAMPSVGSDAVFPVGVGPRYTEHITLEALYVQRGQLIDKSLIVDHRSFARYI